MITPVIVVITRRRDRLRPARRRRRRRRQQASSLLALPERTVSTSPLFPSPLPLPPLRASSYVARGGFIAKRRVISQRRAKRGASRGCVETPRQLNPRYSEKRLAIPRMICRIGATVRGRETEKLAGEFCAVQRLRFIYAIRMLTAVTSRRLIIWDL